MIGDTWSVVVIVALGERPRRYSELLERIGGSLEEDAHADPCASWWGNRPRRQRTARDYALTDLGASLLGVVGALAAWAEAHTDALLAAQSSAA